MIIYFCHAVSFLGAVLSGAFFFVGFLRTVEVKRAPLAEADGGTLEFQPFAAGSVAAAPSANVYVLEFGVSKLASV
jgi:hypothetical protein